MDKKSLEKVRNLIINALDTFDIDLNDKVELMFNLNMFLDPNLYPYNLDVLRKSGLKPLKEDYYEADTDFEQHKRRR